MILALLISGLIVIPLYDIILRMFPSVVIIASDTRGYKEVMLIAFALAVGLAALYHQGFKPFKNKWLLLFVMFQVVTLSMSFKLPLVVNDISSTSFWVWKPLFIGLCAFILFLAVSSVQLTKKQLDMLLFTMCIVGVIEAGYVVLQTFGFDQLFAVKGVGQIGTVGFPGRVGTLGQPTLVSPFMAMTLPLAIYLKRYFVSVLIIIAVLLTHSQIAITAMIIGICLYAIIWKVKIAFVIIPIALIVCGIILVNKKFVVDNGRFSTWKKIVSEIRDGSQDGKIKEQSLTGYGQGSFPYIFDSNGHEERSNFKQAHNEYLELAYNCGLGGLALFLLSIFYFIKKEIILNISNRQSMAILTSFVIISLCALGTFVWQLGAHIYYTVVIAGLLHNKPIIGGENG